MLPSGVIRAFGGYLSDRFGAHTVTWVCMWASLISFFFMSYPPTEYTIQQMGGETLTFNLSMPVWLFTTLLFIVGIAWGIGKASSSTSPTNTTTTWVWCRAWWACSAAWVAFCCHRCSAR